MVGQYSGRTTSRPIINLCLSMASFHLPTRPTQHNITLKDYDFFLVPTMMATVDEEEDKHDVEGNPRCREKADDIGDGDDFQDRYDGNDDSTTDYDSSLLDEDIDRELDRQLDEFIDENQRLIEEELQRQIDHQINSAYQKQMDDYFGQQFGKEKDDHNLLLHNALSNDIDVELLTETLDILNAGEGKTLKALPIPFPQEVSKSSAIPPVSNSAQDINSAIDKVVHQYSNWSHKKPPGG